MSKFKVGDKVRVISKNCKMLCPYHPEMLGKIKTIVKDDGTNRSQYQFGDPGIYGVWGDDELELVEEKPSPLTNTIITDIKDEAQHKRVQEKLFSMGCKWYESYGEGTEVISSYSKQILISKYSTMHNGCYNRLHKHITANEFLQEVDQAVNELPKGDYNITDSGFGGCPDSLRGTNYFGRSAADVLQNIKNQVDKMSEGQPLQPKQRWYGKSIADLLIKANETKTNKTNITSAKADVIKPMNNIVSFFNDLTVSAEDKELRKAGLKNSNLQWTNAAKEIVENLEAKELGLKNFEKLDEEFEFETDTELSTLEYKALFTKFYSKLLDTAKKFNRKDEKKAK